MRYERAISTKELAAILGVGIGTITRLRAEGAIRGYRIRHQIRFFLSEVKRDLLIAEEQFETRRILNQHQQAPLAGGSPSLAVAPRKLRK